MTICKKMYISGKGELSFLEKEGPSKDLSFHRWFFFRPEHLAHEEPRDERWCEEMNALTVRK